MSQSIRQAQQAATRRSTPSEAGSVSQFSKELGLAPLDAARPVEIRWIAGGRVPLGALSVLAGETGSAKSLLAVEWAARESEGNGDTDAALIAHAADMPVEFLRARLDAAGGDARKVAALTLEWPEVSEEFTIGKLLSRVAAIAAAIQAGRAGKLVIIDNLEAWAGNLHQAPSRARLHFLLAKLSELAVKTGVAIVALARLSGPAGGRLASKELADLSAIAPVVWLAASDCEEVGRRLLLPVKNSLGPQAAAVAFRIEAGRIAWDEAPLEASATALVPPSAARVAEQQDRESAGEWLLSALEHGPVESGELFRQARTCGISAKTLRRAGKTLGLKPTKRSFEGPWEWQIRNAECGIRNEQAPGARTAERETKDRQWEDADRQAIHSEFRIPNSELAKMAN